MLGGDVHLLRPRQLYWLLALLSGAGLLYPCASRAQVSPTAQVHVTARQVGQGILRGRWTECFVVVPLHVVDGSLGAVAIVGEVAARAGTQLERRLAGDFAVLRVESASSLACPPWTAPSIASDLNKQDNAVLLSRESDGSLSRMPVAIRGTDADSIYVRPAAARDSITMTMSGSALAVEGTVVGILQSVEQNEGRVIQLDEVLRLTASFFSPPNVETVSRAVLESLQGEYNAGSVMVKVALRQDGVLTSQSAGTPPAVLLHDRDLRFKVEADPNIVLEFRRNAKGEVFALFSHQANGIAPAIRQSAERIGVDQLRPLAGAYQAGTARFIVELNPQGVLTFAAAGNPSIELLFARELQFVIRGSAGAYIEFVRDPNGSITGLYVHGASSIFASRFR